MDYSNKKKILVVFDFDHTIIKGSSWSHPIKNLLTSNEMLLIRERLNKNENYLDIFRDVLLKIKNTGTSFNKVKEIVEKIPLNDGFEDLFKFIGEMKANYKVIMISGTISVFIKWILDRNKISHIFEDIYSHKSEFDEEKNLKISQIHNHECTICNTSQCKGLIMREYLKMNEQMISEIIYIGDGDNDYCPSLILSDKDILFPRKNWGLHQKIRNENLFEKIKCKIVYWNTGEIIKKELIKLNNSPIAKF